MEKKYKSGIQRTDIWKTFVELGKCDKALSPSQYIGPTVSKPNLSGGRLK